MARRRPQIRKIDGNQNEIVNGLRKLGLSVQSLASVGEGCPDILVGTLRRNILFELKMPGEHLNAKQVKWHEEWQGRVYEADSLEGVLTVLRVREVIRVG